MIKNQIKKITIISLILLTSAQGGGQIYAQNKTATNSPTVSKATPTQSDIEDNIKLLREKIATKVAELSQKNKKIISGVINKFEDGTLTITTSKNEKFTANVDDSIVEYKDISGVSEKEIQKKDVKENNFVIISGQEIDDSITAQIIYKDNNLGIGSGKITNVNKDDFSVEVLTTDKEEFIFDIESSTQQKVLDVKTLKLTKSGFSKIQIGDTVHFVYKKSIQTGSKRFIAERFLTIPQDFFLRSR